jgi:hypothetical protein
MLEFTTLMLTTKGLELNANIVVLISVRMYTFIHFQASKFAEQLLKIMSVRTGV